VKIFIGAEYKDLRGKEETNKLVSISTHYSIQQGLKAALMAPIKKGQSAAILFHSG
jgi:hypothetical protein